MQLVTLPVLCGVCQALQVGTNRHVYRHTAATGSRCNAVATVRTWSGQVLSPEPLRHHRGFPFGSVRVGLPADRTVKAISSYETCMSRQIISIAFPRGSRLARLCDEQVNAFILSLKLLQFHCNQHCLP